MSYTPRTALPRWWSYWGKKKNVEVTPCIAHLIRVGTKLDLDINSVSFPATAA